MKTRNLFLPWVIVFSLSMNAQMKINENKYNKLIKGEKHSEALTYLKEKGIANPDTYWFNRDAEQLATFCFDPNFDDNKYDIIVNYANNSFKDMSNKDRSYSEVANCYLVKANHYLWKGDFEKATLAYKESLVKLEKFKKENDINPQDIKAIKSTIDRYYINQTETQKMAKALRNFDVSVLNLSEEKAYEARQEIKKILAVYDQPHKVHFITYDANSHINKEFSSYYFTMGHFFSNYFKSNFFYNMPKTAKNKYFSEINLYNLFDDDKYKTKEEESLQTEQRKASLIKKYGKSFGESIFDGKISIGMTKKILEDEFNKPRTIDTYEYSEFWTWSSIMVTIDKNTQKVTGITQLK